MAALNGKWKLVSLDNFELYLDAVGEILLPIYLLHVIYCIISVTDSFRRCRHLTVIPETSFIVIPELCTNSRNLCTEIMQKFLALHIDAACIFVYFYTHLITYFIVFVVSNTYTSTGHCPHALHRSLT